MSTTTKTITVGTSRAGTTHRVLDFNGHVDNRAMCMDGVQLNNRAWVSQIRRVENGATPSGKLCKKCFPGEGVA